jgi:uncharacterized repeat protein (TIGR01451 family)
MKKSIYLSIYLILGTMFSQINAQIFTKITNSIITQDSSNHHSTAWGDYDNDGDMDLYVSNWFSSVSNPMGLNYLYQNACNGDFAKIRQIPNDVVTDNSNKYGVHWVDYDGDGDLDLHFTKALFENNGNGTFTGGTYNVRWGGPAWLDYDNDGKLDVYYGRKELYHNNGSGDYDVLLPNSFANMNKYLRGDAMTTADVNNDGLMDIFMCSPRSQFGGNYYNDFYQNAGNGVFNQITNNGLSSNFTISYGCAWGDIDNDMDLDVWICKNYNGDLLMKNDGTGNFTNTPTSPIETNINTNQAGAAFADFDNDGDLDLVVPSFYNNFVYQNDGAGNFTQLTSEVIETENSPESYSASWADYDNDGDMDLFIVTSFGDPNDLFYVNNIYQNNSLNGHWVKFDLDGVQSNRQAIGARVYVKATINGTSKWQMREVNLNGNGGGEAGGASGHVVHFGLGDATFMDSIKVVWPASGITQYFTNIAVDQFINVIENQNVLKNVASCTPDLPIKKPSYAKGKMFIDNNNNCTFETGIDYPIANYPIKASPGDYYTYTNNQGDYLFELPENTFEISLYKTERDWIINDVCVTDSVKIVTTVVGDTAIVSYFIVQSTPFSDCGPKVEIDTSSIGLVQGPCNDGLLLTSPCPGYKHRYCFTYTNIGTAPFTPQNQIVIHFPAGFNIIIDSLKIMDAFDSTLMNTSSFVLDSANMLTITINDSLNDSLTNVLNGINIGNGILICVDVNVISTASTPYITTTSFEEIGDTSELVINGGFQVSLNLYDNNPPFFTTNGTFSNTSPSVPGQMWIGTDSTMVAMNPSNCSNPLPPLGQTFPLDSNLTLIVDGAMTAGNFWCQDIPVEPFKQYFFRYSVNNNACPNSTGSTIPRIAMLINGDTIRQDNIGPSLNSTTGGWSRKFRYLCTEANDTVLNYCLSLVNPDSLGNNFSIDVIRANRMLYLEDSLILEDSCSCDPNDKMVSPIGCGPNGNINKNQELTYTVRFQNEGTGPAHDIILRDKLDEDLDLSTLKIISSSHHITKKEIIPNAALILTFKGIELPPKISNEEASKGYIIYKIKPKNSLPDGTVIQNQTGIYFDGNEVVLTNTTKNTLFDHPTPDALFSFKHSCSNTGKIYDFTYTGSTPNNVTFLWSFQGATTSSSTLQNPSNIIFNSTGLKTVSLTVNLNGCIASYEQQIDVKSVLSTNGKKVKICHNGETIEVSVNALQAHLNHGDCVGECNTQARIIQENNSLESKLETKKQELDVSLMPNPANDNLNIKIKQGKILNIEVLNINGTKQNVEIEKRDDLNYHLSTKNLANGFYLLKIQNENAMQVLRFIVHH